MNSFWAWIREGWADGIGTRLVLVSCALMIASIPVVIWKGIEYRKRWDKFSEEHHCKVVSRVAGDVDIGTGVAVTPNGAVGPVVTTTFTPGKTGWLCDDGVVYWR